MLIPLPIITFMVAMKLYISLPCQINTVISVRDYASCNWWRTRFIKSLLSCMSSITNSWSNMSSHLSFLLITNYSGHFFDSLSLLCCPIWSKFVSPFEGNLNQQGHLTSFWTHYTTVKIHHVKALINLTLDFERPNISSFRRWLRVLHVYCFTYLHVTLWISMHFQAAMRWMWKIS